MPPAICRRESVMQLLRVFYWDIYATYLNDPQAEKTAYTHKEELAFRFMQTIVEEHSPNRDVAYFAERLGITPKYLTNLMNEISGQSARDWIVYYTIFEIKALLRESAMDLKTIVARVNFPDQSTLSRFFPQVHGHVPVSIPEEYSFLNDRLGRKPGFFFLLDARAEMFCNIVVFVVQFACISPITCDYRPNLGEIRFLFTFAKTEMRASAELYFRGAER